MEHDQIQSASDTYRIVYRQISNSHNIDTSPIERHLDDLLMHGFIVDRFRYLDEPDIFYHENKKIEDLDKKRRKYFFDDIDETNFEVPDEPGVIKTVWKFIKSLDCCQPPIKFKHTEVVYDLLTKQEHELLHEFCRFKMNVKENWKFIKIFRCKNYNNSIQSYLSSRHIVTFNRRGKEKLSYEFALSMSQYLLNYILEHFCNDETGKQFEFNLFQSSLFRRKCFFQNIETRLQHTRLFLECEIMKMNLADRQMDMDLLTNREYMVQFFADIDLSRLKLYQLIDRVGVLYFEYLTPVISLEVSEMLFKMFKDPDDDIDKEKLKYLPFLIDKREPFLIIFEFLKKLREKSGIKCMRKAAKILKFLIFPVDLLLDNGFWKEFMRGLQHGPFYMLAERKARHDNEQIAFRILETLMDCDFDDARAIVEAKKWKMKQ